MNDTNTAIQLAQQAAALAQMQGFHLSGAQITAIMSAAAMAARWLQLELKVIIAAGGLRNIFGSIWSGSGKLPVAISPTNPASDSLPPAQPKVI